MGALDARRLKFFLERYESLRVRPIPAAALNLNLARVSSAWRLKFFLERYESLRMRPNGSCSPKPKPSQERSSARLFLPVGVSCLTWPAAHLFECAAPSLLRQCMHGPQAFEQEGEVLQTNHPSLQM